MADFSRVLFTCLRSESGGISSMELASHEYCNESLTWLFGIGIKTDCLIGVYITSS